MRSFCHHCRMPVLVNEENAALGLPCPRCRRPLIPGRSKNHWSKSPTRTLHEPHGCVDSRCPKCSQPIFQDANSAGRVIACPNCQHEFQLHEMVSAKWNGMPIWVLGVVAFSTWIVLFVA